MATIQYRQDGLMSHRVNGESVLNKHFSPHFIIWFWENNVHNIDIFVPIISFSFFFFIKTYSGPCWCFVSCMTMFIKYLSMTQRMNSAYTVNAKGE